MLAVVQGKMRRKRLSVCVQCFKMHNAYFWRCFLLFPWLEYLPWHTAESSHLPYSIVTWLVLVPKILTWLYFSDAAVDGKAKTARNAWNVHPVSMVTVNNPTNVYVIKTGLDCFVTSPMLNTVCMVCHWIKGKIIIDRNIWHVSRIFSYKNDDINPSRPSR